MDADAIGDGSSDSGEEKEGHTPGSGAPDDQAEVGVAGQYTDIPIL